MVRKYTASIFRRPSLASHLTLDLTSFSYLLYYQSKNHQTLSILMLQVLFLFALWYTNFGDFTGGLDGSIFFLSFCKDFSLTIQCYNASSTLLVVIIFNVFFFFFLVLFDFFFFNQLQDINVVVWNVAGNPETKAEVHPRYLSHISARS